MFPMTSPTTPEGIRGYTPLDGVKPRGWVLLPPGPGDESLPGWLDTGDTMHRCYPQFVFDRAANLNIWRLRDRGATNVWIAVVKPIGRLVVTRHPNGRLQVQGVPTGTQRARDADLAIHLQMQDALVAIAVERSERTGVTIMQARQEIEDEWHQESRGISGAPPPRLAL
jgi:hypothetical protein